MRVLYVVWSILLLTFFVKGICPHVLLLESMSSVCDEFKRCVNDIISKVEKKRDGLTRVTVRDVFKGK